MLKTTLELNLPSPFILDTRILKATVKVTQKVMREMDLELRTLDSQSCSLSFFSGFTEI